VNDTRSVERVDATCEAYRAVRRDVFVDEQDVPADVEFDEHEAAATHYLGRDGERAVAAARSREYDAATVKVERLAVRADARERGWGSRLMDAVEADARDAGYETALLHAQTHATGFYESRGYERVSDEFEEAGIPHVAMEKPL